MQNESILFIPCTEGTAGGSLQGTIQASFANLREMFGKPAFEGKGDKITTEFCIDFEYYDGIDDEVQYGSFSLYDWHYARNFNDDYEVITWNVGGKGYLSSIAADLAMKIFNDTDTRYGYDDAVLCHANWHDCDSIAA